MVASNLKTLNQHASSKLAQILINSQIMCIVFKIRVLKYLYSKRKVINAVASVIDFFITEALSPLT